MLNEDCWIIIKSFMFNKKDINRRLFIKQLNFERYMLKELLKEEEKKWKWILFVDRIRD